MSKMQRSNSKSTLALKSCTSLYVNSQRALILGIRQKGILGGADTYDSSLAGTAMGSMQNRESIYKLISFVVAELLSSACVLIDYHKTACSIFFPFLAYFKSFCSVWAVILLEVVEKGQ